jgi:DNA polymerase
MNLQVQPVRCVMASGSPNSRIMLVGEAPGEEEERRGLPSLGRAGWNSGAS